jgi:phosphatidylserine decarboxylase
MKIHKEGYSLLIIFFIILGGLLILSELLFPEKTPWHYLFYFACFVSLAFLAGFFRAPRRELDDEAFGILCPADGKVVVIEKVYDEEFFKAERLQVSIFMSPLNVHINWYPLSGIIDYFKYHPGKYLVAWHPKSSTENERTTVVVNHEKHGQVLIRQIAGAVARRIVCYSKPGTNVKQGTELGFIKFGSRVDLLLPLDVDIQVELNQRVVGKKTLIATFKDLE